MVVDGEKGGGETRRGRAGMRGMSISLTRYCTPITVPPLLYPHYCTPIIVPSLLYPHYCTPITMHLITSSTTVCRIVPGWPGLCSRPPLPNLLPATPTSAPNKTERAPRLPPTYQISNYEELKNIVINPLTPAPSLQLRTNNITNDC